MKYRAIVIPVAGAILVLGGFLLFGNLNQNLVYYYTPAEVVAKKATLQTDERFRLGGLVAEGSVVQTKSVTRFTLVSADGTALPVVYKGVPAQLFAAGIGAIVEGTWSGDSFYADTMMVKHDSNYRAPEGAAHGTGNTGDEGAP